MWLRLLAGVVPMVGGAMMYSGAIPVASLFGGSSYHTEVAAPPSRVAAALSDLDMDEITRSGMTMSAYPNSLVHKRTADGIVWTLKVGGAPMLDLVATLTPAQNGEATRIATEVREGAAYDERKIARGLQDKQLVGTIFHAALDMELNAFAPPAQRKSQQVLKEERMATVLQAMQLKMMSNPMAVAVEARQREIEFKDDMAAARAEADKPKTNAGVTFKPGEPMVDVGGTSPQASAPGNL